jgi:hypothetical protein
MKSPSEVIMARTTGSKKVVLTREAKDGFPNNGIVEQPGNGFAMKPASEVTLRSDFMVGIAGCVRLKGHSKPIVIFAPDWESFRFAFMEIHPDTEPDQNKCQSVVEAAIGLFDYKDIEPKNPVEAILESFNKWWFYLPDVQKVTQGNSNSQQSYFGSNIKHIVKIAPVDKGTELEAKLLMRKAGYSVMKIREMKIVPFDIEEEIPF